MGAMCIQCAAGAMTAVGAASGSRLYLEARFPVFTRPRVRKTLRRSIVVAGVVAASVLGGSPHAAQPGAGSSAAATAPISAAAPHAATGGLRGAAPTR
jgi:hypothetical protein